MKCSNCGCENSNENIQCEVCEHIFESKSKKGVKINQMNVMAIATISFIVFIIIGIVGISFLNSDYFEKKEMFQAIESKDCRQVISVLEEQSTYNVAVKTLDDYLTEIYYDICNNENIYDISDAIQYLHDISGTILIDENNNVPLQKYGSYYVI